MCEFKLHCNYQSHKKIIFVFVTAINSAVFKSYYTKHHLFFELLSNVDNFVAMELAP